MDKAALDALAALCAEHPGPYRLQLDGGVPRSIFGPDEYKYEIWIHEEGSEEWEIPWITALIAKANAVPALLAHIRTLEQERDPLQATTEDCLECGKPVVTTRRSRVICPTCTDELGYT